MMGSIIITPRLIIITLLVGAVIGLITAQFVIIPK